MSLNILEVLLISFCKIKHLNVLFKAEQMGLELGLTR